MTSSLRPGSRYLDDVNQDDDFSANDNDEQMSFLAKTNRGPKRSNSNSNGSSGSSSSSTTRQRCYWAAGALGLMFLALYMKDASTVQNTDLEEVVDQTPATTTTTIHDVPSLAPVAATAIADAANSSTTEVKIAEKESVDTVAAVTPVTEAPVETVAATTTTPVASTGAPATGAPTAAPVATVVAAVPDTTTAAATTSTTTDGLTPGFKKPDQIYSDTYLPRGKPLTDVQREALTKDWGSWTFASKTTPNLPVDQYPNGDIPRFAFPDGAWQTDVEYLKDWLANALALTQRTLDAMLAQYGQGVNQTGLFDVTLIPPRNPGAKAAYPKTSPGNAGYASPDTMDALTQRLLHAVVTQGSFTVVMGGHSSAAGHGNHFRQSYTMQIQRILEPLLARLGVHHTAHNFGMGGLGTAQNALAAQSLYGKDIDVLIWDSSMTETDEPSKDLFCRQGMLGEGTVPVMWGDADRGVYGARLPGAGSISTGMWGTGLLNMPVTESATQVETLPYWSRYLNCAKEASDLCKDNRYNGTCWMEREDVTPVVEQKAVPGGQAKWHPGNRVHLHTSRMISFQMVRQLQVGLQQWYDTPDFELPDKAWHVTDDYNRIRDGVRNLTDTACHDKLWPSAACNVPLHGRSEFTPRANPTETSIRTLVKKGIPIPEPEPNLYDPPDSRLPMFDTPDGHVDVLAIVENGGPFLPHASRRARADKALHPPAPAPQTDILHADLTPPGQGWGLNTQTASDNCDGTWDSFCARGATADCLLQGHADHRGGLIFDSLSGWLVMNIPKVEHGVMFVRMEDWVGANGNPATDGWWCENGTTDCEAAKIQAKEDAAADGGRFLRSVQRQVETADAQCVKDNKFRFEFAIDGKVTSWTWDQFHENRKQVQRVVHLWTFLDDKSYVSDGPKDIEVAMRMTGCQRELTFHLSHVYWA